MENKRLAVLGANGRTGKVFVEMALERGYKVRAGIHAKNTLTKQGDLEIVEIDATKLDDVTKLVEGCDAIISLIGHVKGSPKNLQTNIIRNITKAAEKTGVQRIVSLTGTGVRFSGDKPSLADKFLTRSLELVMGDIIHDGRNHAEVLKQSDTKWTIVRASILTNAPLGAYRLSPHDHAKFLTPRTEVCDAILQVIEKDSFIREAPLITR